MHTWTQTRRQELESANPGVLIVDAREILSLHCRKEPKLLEEGRACSIRLDQNQRKQFTSSFSGIVFTRYSGGSRNFLKVSRLFTTVHIFSHMCCSDCYDISDFGTAPWTMVSLLRRKVFW